MSRAFVMLYELHVLASTKTWFSKPYPARRMVWSKSSSNPPSAAGIAPQLDGKLAHGLRTCDAVVRVAGNIVNDDMLGNMEFACAVSGAKVVLVLGHTACGAVKGAIDDVVLGNLTGLLARVKAAIPATKFDGEKSSKNASYVDAVARTNVVLGSLRSADAAQSWKGWRGKEALRSSVRCTILQLALSSSSARHCVAAEDSVQQL